MTITPELVEYILLGSGDSRRHLQDSPILGDVWIAYASDPFSTVDLLVTSHKETTAVKLAAEIYTHVTERRDSSDNDPRVAPLQGFVAAELYFDEVAEILVPMSKWWHEDRTKKELSLYVKPEHIKGREELEKLGQTVADVRILLERWWNKNESNEEMDDHHRSAFERFVALCALVFMAGSDRSKRRYVVTEAQKKEVNKKTRTEIQAASNVDNVIIRERVLELLRKMDVNRKPMVFQISRNREASAAIARSVPTVKADAAWRLFDIDVTPINWAVLDSGIYTDHSAFKLAAADPDRPATCIKHTYDFTFYREVVDLGNVNDATRRENLEVIKRARGGKLPAGANNTLKKIAKNCVDGLPLRWDLIEIFVELGANPSPPSSLHGTHVAGIIGARKTTYPDSANGMCPGIGIDDFRILGSDATDTEVAIIAALQFIREKNQQAGFLEINGVNMSLSIPHSVRNYACGGTPICMECDRLIESGVVVVAAAGNHGYQQTTEFSEAVNNYRAFSITDPGNAERVITVGSTHRFEPFTFGVSYFSSRGPTGDGRLKPDIVAPGERIWAPVPGKDSWDYLDGTSMAAPHVSGAAALLMARYPELIGKPDKIKRILCETATDLGRERNFQGHGMLDVLRALQSQ